MTTIFLDPSFRRARIVRVTVAGLLVLSVGAVGICALGLRAKNRPAPTLPAPRRAIRVTRRHPVYGRRPSAGQSRIRRPIVQPVGEVGRGPIDDRPPSEVIAFVDPSVTGAVQSVRAHADQITQVAATGLFLGPAGTVIDQIDEGLLAVTRERRLRAVALIQNIGGGNWQPEVVRALSHNRRARHRLAEQLLHVCEVRRLVGIHLDFEELDDDWTLLVPIAADVASVLHAHHLELAVDLAAGIDGAALAAIGRVADRIVVMAYDESDDESAPGPIASNDYVAETLRSAAEHVSPTRLTAGLALYGYDWVGREPADPISFVEAHAAAKEAHVQPHWDSASGNLQFHYSDDEGAHEIWMTDAATLWNQLRLASRERVRSVALWRLGGEDPGVWQALARRPPEDLGTVPPDERVENFGNGPFLSLSLAPAAGQRQLRVADGQISEEEWRTLPSPFVIRRAGIVPGKVALTFDDGPDERFTPMILDILRREGVPASFFIVGVRALQAPAIVQREFAEGHEVGNHSFTHPNVDAVGDDRLRIELESTSRLIQTIIGHRPLLYRPPALADIEPRSTAGAAAFARAGSLGYLVVDADVDPRDWEQPSADQLVASVMSETRDGGVVLLHDGGRDRSTTVRSLPRIIAGLRARGLQFVPVAELVGKRRADVMPAAPPVRTVADLSSYAVFDGASLLLRATTGSLVAGLVVVGFRMILLVAFALAADRKRRPTLGPLPSVTAVVPAYNECTIITRTIDSLLASDVPLEVLVVDDGSTDGTAEWVKRRYLGEARVRLLHQANAGKAAALRAGFLACRSEVVVALDGDTLFAPDTVRRLIEPLRDAGVGAVAGTVEVGNVEGAFTACQALEYLTQQELERRAWDLFSAVPIVPGAVGAWRRRAVLELGGVSSQTLAEDADLAMALCRSGWRVVHAPSARARTEAPSGMRALLKQRYRWSFGVMQAMWKHRGALIEPRAGAFGRVVLPTMLLFQILLPLLAPLAVLGGALALATGNWRPPMIATGCLLAIEWMQLAVACTLERRSRGAGGWRLFGWVLGARLIYRPLLLAVTLRSILRILDGVPLGWDKLLRRGTAVGFAASTMSAKISAR